MQTIVLILVLAITVEALIQYSKTIIEMLEKKQYKTFATQLAAILLSVFICFAAGVDLYTQMCIRDSPCGTRMPMRSMWRPSLCSRAQ